MVEKHFDIVWKVAGEAGQGILTTGFIIGKAFSQNGYNVFTSMENPSLIRGGHNTIQVRVSDYEQFCSSPNTDVLVALNKESVDLHYKEIVKGGTIIYDAEKVVLTEEEEKEIKANGVHLIPIPFLKTCTDNALTPLMSNVLAAGASIAMTPFFPDFLAIAIEKNFEAKHKDPTIIESNLKAAKAGYEFVTTNFPEVAKQKMDIPVIKGKPKTFFNGSEAFCLGALRAGCKFVAEYPMTPSTVFLTFMAAHEKDYNLVVKHTEDEIAALGFVIGAGYAGARAMTATSGGGFSLMVEYLGLAGMTEVPCVVINTQRPGPSTGLPTWTEQADLRFVIHASQGEFPRVVLALGDLEDHFYYAAEAFNIADKLQGPVIVLTEKVAAESKQTIEASKLDESKITIDRGKMITTDGPETTDFYPRYLITPDGISPRPLPGTRNIYTQASDEHDEFGEFNENAQNRIDMVDKRARKLETIMPMLPKPKLFGNPNAKLIMVGFGSTKFAAMETIEKYERKGIDVAFLQLITLYPFQTDIVTSMLKGKNFMVVEGNHDGQLESLIRENCLITPIDNYRRYDGRNIDAFDLMKKVDEVLKKLK